MKGLGIDSEGNVYVSDQGNDRLQVFDPQGMFLRKWGIRGSGDGEFSQPQVLAIDSEGNVYVSEYGNDRIQVFDPQGRFMRKWGIRGTGLMVVVSAFSTWYVRKSLQGSSLLMSFASVLRAGYYR